MVQFKKNVKEYTISLLITLQKLNIFVYKQVYKIETGKRDNENLDIWK